MKFHKLAIGLVLTISAVAFATVITTNRITGTGTAVSSTGVEGFFTVDATKVVSSAGTTLNGTVDFTVSGPGELDSTEVHMTSVQVMNVFNSKGSMGGPATLRVEVDGAIGNYVGRANFFATSNRHPGEAGAWDTVTIYFIPNSTLEPTFRFQGLVPTGDVEVSTTQSF